MKPALLTAAAALLALTACDDDPRRTRLEFAPQMYDSVAFETFAPNPNTKDGKTLLRPPEGTLPRGFTRTHFAAGEAEAKRAAAELHNPLAATPATLQRGAATFATFCTPCHGKTGLGDGLVVPKFPAPPALNADHAKQLADGQLFHIITHGQGLMPGHGAQVPPEDRWRLVHHLRALQGGATASAPAAPAPVELPGAPSTPVGGMP